MGSRVAAPTSACWPTATRRGPAAAALASAWAVMGSHARVSNTAGCACLLGWVGKCPYLPPHSAATFVRCREIKELVQSFTTSKGQRQNLNPHLKTGLFPLSHSSSTEDYTSPFIHTFIQQVSMHIYYVSGTILAMRIQQ